MTTEAMDLLSYATDGLVLSSRPAPKGEGDALRAVPPRIRRQLAGAGYLSSRGDFADVLCDRANDRLGRDMSVCEFVEWYVRTARLAVVERRRHARRRRMVRLCRAAGVRSEYEWRRVHAEQLGYPSVHALCVARGWR